MAYRTMSSAPSVAATNAFLRGVYHWMTAGLLVTALVAYGVVTSAAIAGIIFGSPLVFWGLVLGELGLVLAISGAVHRMSAGTATGLFLLYSALNGATLSAVLLAYSGAAVFKAFLVTAGTFGVMSIYGATTQRDLSGMGSFLFMGLVGIILASVVNIFLASPAVDFVISAVGVLVFTGLTAYDTQMLRQMGETAPMDDALAIRRGTILGALRLYLDFINLFLMLLRFFGGSRD
ncbi:membrane protein [Thermodesulfomicrobium sp. WS]|uniref:Bax inhibitor-1/YccA family protein n=1 Tax=Thermodesulfomicrobium sp. WS TaxID=3004129 RepID=UPI00248FA963|nr:Bax inhibitor-1/YccA family protein [Thermodesulfomicrobium sp. WS]BDV02027.1 membrane protein [Thermodesulfomicrobium sp. WS]